MRNITEYTEQEIDALEAGRETDALVAEFICGWVRGWNWVGSEKQSVLRHPTDGAYWPDEFPHYSTGISAAWLVIEKMRALGWWVSVNTTCDAGKFDALFSNPGLEFSSVFQPAQLAICRAALKAIRAMRLREKSNA